MRMVTLMGLVAIVVVLRVRFEGRLPAQDAIEVHGAERHLCIEGAGFPEIFETLVLAGWCSDPVPHVILQAAGFIKDQRSTAVDGEVLIAGHSTRFFESELVKIAGLHANLLR